MCVVLSFGRAHTRARMDDGRRAIKRLASDVVNRVAAGEVRVDAREGRGGMRGATRM